MRCVKCGCSNPGDRVRCLNCDSSLVTRGCERCGRSIPEEDFLCYSCSAVCETRVSSDKVCRSCNFPNGSSSTRCGRCGRPLPGAEALQQPFSEDDIPATHVFSLPRRHRSIEAFDRSSSSMFQFMGSVPRFVGRRRELERLIRAYMKVKERGRAMMVTITGEAGVGKTRLVHQFLDRLSRRKEHPGICNVSLEQVGDPGELATAFIDTFVQEEKSDGQDRKDSLVALLFEVRPAREASEDAYLLGHLMGLQFPESPVARWLERDQEAVDKKALHTLARLIIDQTAKRPMVAILDQLHLANASLRSFIDELLSALGSSRVLIVTVGTPELYDLSPDWVNRDFETLGMELAPLGDDDCRRLLSQLLSKVDRVPRELVSLCCSKASGNPMVVQQVVRILLDHRVLVARQDRWTVDLDRLKGMDIPATLGELVRARLDRLDPRSRRVLQIASVVGERFWLGAVLSCDLLEPLEDEVFWFDEQREEGLREVLLTLQGADFIEYHKDSLIPGEVEFSFINTLEYEQVYNLIPPLTREKYHLMVAQWLGRRLQLGRQPGPEAMARHLERGGRLGEAARYYLAAAEEARYRYDNQRALELYGRVLETCEEDKASVRVDALLGAGLVHMPLAELEDAYYLFKELLRYSVIIESPSKGGMAYNRMGMVLKRWGEFDQAMRHYRSGLELFRRGEDPAGVASSLDDIGDLLVTMGTPGAMEEALGYFKQSLEQHEKLGQQEGKARSMYSIASVYLFKGFMQECRRYLKEAMEIQQRAGNRMAMTRCWNLMGYSYHDQGQLDMARECYKKAMDLAVKIGDREYEGIVNNNLGECALDSRDLGSAVSYLDAAVEILAAIGDKRVLSDVYRNLGRVLSKLGEHSQAVEYCRKGVELAREIGSTKNLGVSLRLMGELLSTTMYGGTEHGEGHERAEACFSESLRVLDGMGNEVEKARTMEVYGKHLMERGQIAGGRKLYEEATKILSRVKSG